MGPPTVERDARLRPGKACPGRADPGVGQARATARDRVQRDASGLGRNPRARGVAPRLQPRHGAAAADGRRRCRYRDLAGRRPGSGRGDRAPLSRPPRPPVRSRPTDPAERGGPPAPVGRSSSAWRMLPIPHQIRRSERPGTTRPQPALEPSDDPHSRTHRDRPADRRGLRLHRRLRPRRRMGPEYDRRAAAGQCAARAGRPVCARGADGGTDRADGVSDHRVRPPATGRPRRRGIGRGDGRRHPLRAHR